MTRDELLQLINLKEELIAAGKQNRPGVTIRPSKITIHNTSNTSAGANADMHSRFVRNTGFYIITDKNGNKKKIWVSWHFSVDDNTAIRQLPSNEKAFHAHTQANNTSIAIEVCMNKDIDQDAANERAAQLTALLCHDLSIPITGVVTHKFWTQKNCPVLLLQSWDAFIARVRHYVDELSAESTNAAMLDGVAEKSAGGELEAQLCWTSESVEAIDDKPIEKKKPDFHIQYGFYNWFLKNEVVLPVFKEGHAQHDNYVFSHHRNLSIYFNKNRKLALYTACNFNKDAFIKVDRSDSFRDDCCIDLSMQTRQGFYDCKENDNPKGGNYFDRGHMIARRYNQWGATEAQASEGERDTYVFTAITPQVGELNQDEWEKLESFIIEKGALDVPKVSIISGALLLAKDPIATYTDKYYQKTERLRVPTAFWKIVYYKVGDELRKIAFLMSQRNRLKELPFVEFDTFEAFDPTAMVEDPFNKLGDPLKTYIVKSSLIETALDISFSPAAEMYDKDEPLEVVLGDNETHKAGLESASFTVSNILQYI